MKQIKRGRGPSFMNFIGSICIILFCSLWTIIALNTYKYLEFPTSLAFPLLGIIGILMGIFHAIYIFKNFSSKEKFSEYDITDDEKDSLGNFQFKNSENSKYDTDRIIKIKSKLFNYCPYCGEKLNESYNFCPDCGKKL